MRKKVKLVSLIGVLLLMFIAWFGMTLSSSLPQSPEKALQSFYDREVAEDQIMDPLILAGPSVIPLLAKAVTKSDMPNRRYAIGALGNLGGKSALPILKTLAREKSEEAYIRCDALVAIGMIDYEEGSRMINSVRGEGLQCLSEIVGDHDYEQWLKSNAPKRTYFQALLGRHN